MKIPTVDLPNIPIPNLDTLSLNLEVPYIASNPERIYREQTATNTESMVELLNAINETQRIQTETLARMEADSYKSDELNRKIMKCHFRWTLVISVMTLIAALAPLVIDYVLP